MKNKYLTTAGFRVFIVLTSCALLASVSTYVLYDYTKTLLKERLQERLVAIVSTAAAEIDSDAVSKVKNGDSSENQSLVKLVDQLERMRGANSDITYAYIMRRTDQKDLLEFVADADTLLPIEEWDLNENGEIEDDEAIPQPGDEFDASEYPALKERAFIEPVAADELETDQWSTQLSAYAPLLDSKDVVVGIVGIDVTVDDFNVRTQAMLMPFLYFILGLIFLLTLMTLLLVRVYNQRVEAIKEIDRQKDELLSIVSHQLATPISSMKWTLEMMIEGDVGELTSEQQEHVSMMEKIVVNLSDLVSMILDVSRIQLGRMKVDRSDINLKDFFDEVITVISPKAREKDIQFNISIPDKLPSAMLDRRLMHMTLENLLSNAVKYTDNKGEVSLDVQVVGSNLLYTVRDTGCGIPKEDQSKLFSKLFRASNVQKIDGNGFGLYVAKGAVESQGGTISFSSTEGKGTTFSVNLPLDKN